MISSRHRVLLKASALAGFLILVAWVLFGTEAGREVRPERIRDTVLAYGALAPVIYIVIYTVAGLLFVPATVLSLAGGLAFGPLWGTLLTLVGATGGASAAFWAARWLGREAVARSLPGWLARCDAFITENGFSFILTMRLIPLVPFNALNYASGLCGVRFLPYAAATFLGIIPGTFAYVYLGNTLINIYSTEFLVAMLLLAALTALPWAWRRRARWGATTGSGRPRT